MSNNFNRYQTNNNANWESQMFYAERTLQQELAQETPDYPKRVLSNEELERRRLRKRTLKRAGILTFALVGLATAPKELDNTFIDPGSTVDNRIGYQVKMSDTRINGLDNETPEREFQQIENPPEKIVLESGSYIRTNDWSYKNMNSRKRGGVHTEIATTQEDLEFEIPNGAVYGTNGRIGVRIEDLEKTTDGRYTGIKPEVDKDGWVFVNIEPEER